MPPIGSPPPTGAGGFSSGLSATSASVVSISPAMEAAFWRAARVTFTGSITPAATRSVISPAMASNPTVPEASSTPRTTMAPSWPAFTAMSRVGAVRAWWMMRAPVASSLDSESAADSTADRARIRAVPPPATMPSSMAARVAEMASSMRCFFSLSSISVAAPTWTTATPPASLASRSWSFSRSQSESVLSISALIWLTRPSTSAALPAPSTMVVSSLVTTTLRAEPISDRSIESSLRPTSSATTCPPVRMAMSWSIALRRSPKPGALTATELNVPRILLTTSVARASPSTSSAMTSSGLPDCMTFSSTGSRSWTLEILPWFNRT